MINIGMMTEHQVCDQVGKPVHTHAGAFTYKHGYIPAVVTVGEVARVVEVVAAGLVTISFICRVSAVQQFANMYIDTSIHMNQHTYAYAYGQLLEALKSHE